MKTTPSPRPAAHLRRTSFWQILPFLLLLALATARAGFVETFDDGGDNGDWHLTSDPDRLLVIETNGGNPGPYLHGQVDSSIPTWYVPTGTSPTQFTGNYVTKRVGAISFDLVIFSGLQVPNRNVTLDLLTSLGTGDFGQGVEAYYIGRDISHLPKGWHTYAFPLDATSPTIPPGWVVINRATGQPGTDADWRALVQDVETVGLELFNPGYLYPDSFWDLGLDNVRIAHRYKAR